MANLWWIYYPKFFPDDVILLNFASRQSLSLRIYERSDGPPRKITLADIGGVAAKDILRLAAWREAVEAGIDVDKRPEWWRGQSRSALRRARAGSFD